MLKPTLNGPTAVPHSRRRMSFGEPPEELRQHASQSLRVDARRELGVPFVGEHLLVGAVVVVVVVDRRVEGHA